MQPSSNRRLLFLLAAILLISAIWTGANRSAGTVAAQGNGKAAGRTPIVLNTKPVRVVADAAPVLSGAMVSRLFGLARTTFDTYRHQAEQGRLASFDCTPRVHGSAQPPQFFA